MKVTVYLVQYRDGYWDIPPYMYETHCAVLNKAEAISIAQKLSKKENAPDEVRVVRQVQANGEFLFKTVYYLYQGEVQKID